MVGLRLLLLLLLLGAGGGTGDGARASEDTSFHTEAREWMDGAEIRTIQSMSLGARGDVDGLSATRRVLERGAKDLAG